MPVGMQLYQGVVEAKVAKCKSEKTSVRVSVLVC